MEAILLYILIDLGLPSLPSRVLLWVFYGNLWVGIWDTAVAVSVINSFGEFSVQSKASVVGVEF